MTATRIVAITNLFIFNSFNVPVSGKPHAEIDLWRGLSRTNDWELKDGRGKAVGNKNELNGKRKSDLGAGRCADPVRAYRSGCADESRRAMGDLTNGAVFGGLVGPVGVERFRR